MKRHEIQRYKHSARKVLRAIDNSSVDWSTTAARSSRADVPGGAQSRADSLQSNILDLGTVVVRAGPESSGCSFLRGKRWRSMRPGTQYKARREDVCWHCKERGDFMKVLHRMKEIDDMWRSRQRRRAVHYCIP